MTAHTSTPLAALALVLLGLTTMVSATTKDQYCRLCSTHTMCQFGGVAQACRGGRFEHNVGGDQKQVVVNAHNAARQRVAKGQESRGSPGPQPRATNMQNLAWDDELATVAQRWADQCKFEHDKCRNVPRFSVGQNLYIKSQWPCSSVNSKQEWGEAVNAWYNEVEKFNRNGVGKYEFSEATGHYTQLVWANTNRVGCGYTLYQEGDQCKKFYVCNYGPAGNVIGQPIYKT